MPTAYICEPGAAVKRLGRTLVVTKDNQTLTDIEQVHLSQLVLVGRVALTTPAATSLLAAGIPTAFVSSRGRLVGRLVPPMSGAIEVRLGQFHVYTDPAQRLAWAKKIVTAKARSMLDVLVALRTGRGDARDAEAERAIADTVQHVIQAESLRALLGLEGAAAAAYWKALPRSNSSALTFAGRSRRPPRDEINAMLSFGYTLLAKEASATLEALGMDPYLGVYHEPRVNRPALALDVIEPYRHALVDRLVIRAANRGRFKPDDFTTSEGRGPRFTPAALRRFLQTYERAALAPACGLPRHDRDDQSLSMRDHLRRRCERLATAFRKVNRSASGASRTDTNPGEQLDMAA